MLLISPIWVVLFDIILFTQLGDCYFGKMGEQGLNMEWWRLMWDIIILCGGLWCIGSCFYSGLPATDYYFSL